MRALIAYVLLLLLLLVFLPAATVLYKKRVPFSGFGKKDVIGCDPSQDQEVIADENGKFMPPMAGWGSHSFHVSTTNDSSQFYFNQGLNFYYGYHLKEAFASFKEAARFDENCAMAYWGQALSLGPYYNTYYYRMPKEVAAILQLMARHLSAANEKEKALIEAMQLRYSDDTSNADRPRLDSSYGSAMSALIQRYPQDNDIKSLYIDAVMLQHKWDFWYNDGKPKAWTPAVVKLCEEILANDTVNPAALHYYIHLTEASRHPQVALHSADVLKDALPGVAHMVHMATHEYQRNGLYAKGVYVNEEANTVSNMQDSLAPLIGRGRNTVIHLFAVQSYCAMNAGMYKKAIPVYSRARNRVVDLNGDLEKDLYLQFVYMMPAMAQVRLGKWKEILGSKRVDKRWIYASTLDHFARGLAYVAEKNPGEARKCLDQLQSNLADSRLAIRIMPQNKPLQSCKIAEGILKGEILFAEDRQNSALAALQEAVDEEDKLVYTEPNNWLIPSRQYLGAYLLKLNKAKEAEAVYREDLVGNPSNGWSLLGLQQSLLAQKRKAEAATYDARRKKAFEDADVVPVASVF